MRTVAPTYKYQSPAAAADDLVAIRQKLKDTRRELKEALEVINRLGLVSADGRYRRLQRFELMEEIISEFLDPEDDDEDEDE